jgi:RHH-type transcriptional regulator, rel operon repressor / antitoxin RelB
MAKALSIRLPDNIAEKLEYLSNEIHRNKTFIIKSALEKYLDEYADYQIALDRLRDKDDKIITSNEMRKTLGI